MRTLSSILAAVTLAALPAVAHADDSTKRTAEAAAKTTADAAVDSARTIGRSTKALVKDGTPAAKRAWRDNAQITSEDAKANAAATRAAAHSQ